MARRKILVSLPTLNNKNGDASKQWYVEYGVRNPKSDKLERFRVYEGLSIVPPDIRYKRAQEIIKEYTQKLKSGWSPLLENPKYIYQDTLIYKEVAKAFGNSRVSNATVNYYANEYLKHITPNINAEGSLPTYRSKLRVFCGWIEMKGFAENDISAITNKIILDFFYYLYYERNFSDITQKKYRQILSDLFEYLYKNKKILDNPVYDIEIIKNEKDMASKPMSDEDRRRFVRAAKEYDPQLLLAFSFEYYCYLRPTKEVRLLQIGDIDFARGIINVSRFRVKRNKRKFPTIPLVFLDELREVYKLHTYPKHFYVFGKNYQPGDTHLSKNNLRGRFNNIRTMLNMPLDYTFYSGKHTGNCMAFDSEEISLKDMQDQNGHTSSSTTEIYIKNRIGKVNKAIRNNFPGIES